VYGIKNLVDFLKKHNIPIPEKILEFLNFDILIVDDDTEILRLIKKTLSKHYPDAEIHEAIDGFEAGQKITQLVPRLVILDIKLPGMDGLKVCQNIRSDKRLDNSKILVISGHDIETYKKEFLEAGADDFLVNLLIFRFLWIKSKNL